jgi:hypothetical protein
LFRLRIIVTGLAATYPLGGVFWDYLQYVLGFARLGHEVLYLEDTARWCYDPDQSTFIESGSGNAAYLARELPKLGPELVDRWFFRDITGATWGWEWAKVVEFCRSADLFINISASCHMRPEYFKAARTVFIDSDPMYTQAPMPEYALGKAINPKQLEQIEMMLAHDAFFTFGENLNSPDCLVPSMVVDWIPTRQPIVNECFAGVGIEVPPAARRKTLTTVMSWEPAEKGPVVNGIAYTGKSSEFLRFLDLPASSPLPMEIAISGSPPRDRLRDAGWRLVEAQQVSRDPWIYRDYLANSIGEWSVAKNAYVASNSGWFSCRSACYLSLAVPVIVQDTGFGCALPSGEGILRFSNVDEALAAIEALAADPVRHARAAREIAHEYFDYRKVLTHLIDRAMAASRRSKPISPVTAD